MNKTLKIFLLLLVSMFGITTHEIAAKRVRQITTDPAPEAKRERIQCSICQDDIKNPKKLNALFTCDHIFHEGCITPWIKQKGNFALCPTCRATLKVLEPSIDNLQRAIISDNISLVENFIAAQKVCGRILELISMPDGNGTTPLMFACQKSHTNIINLLINLALEAGTSFLEFVNTRDNQGRNALIYAMQNGRINVIRFIIEKALVTNNAPVLWRIICCNDTQGFSPFFSAVKNKQIQTTLAFIENLQITTTLENEEIDGITALFLAIANKDKIALNALLTSFPNITTQQTQKFHINIWQSALIIALQANNFEALGELIYAATQNGHTKQHLLAQGLDINPILVAISLMDLDAVELFMKHYHNEMLSNTNLVALQIDWRVRLIMDTYFNLNPSVFDYDAQNHNELPTTIKTLLIALRLAVSKNNYDMILHIIADATFRHEVDARSWPCNIFQFLMVRDRNGDTPLTIANNPVTISLFFANFLESKENLQEFIRIANKEGDTALTIFSRKGLVWPVKLILNHLSEVNIFALINKKNKQEETALTIAANINSVPHKEIAQLLKEHLPQPSFEDGPE